MKPLLLTALLTTAFALTAPTRAATPTTPDLSTVLGVTHIDGKYHLTTDEDFLDEGADQILATGSKVLKIEMMQRYAQKYPFNTDWPKDVDSLVALAQTAPYTSVFHKPFKTYILTAYTLAPYSENYWTAGVSPDQAARETRQFHDLAAHFLTAYKGTGKTFILSHWEGDWALRAPHTFDHNYTPTPTAIQGMIDWLNARQKGIALARAEHPDSDVKVYGATEANLVKDSMNGRPGVANSVLPHTNVDLVEYSSWESLHSTQALSKAIDYLAAHLPNTAAFGPSPRSVILGEFGRGENNGDPRAATQPNHPSPEQLVADQVNVAVDVTIAKHLPYAVYWEVYCNEPKTNAPAAVTIPGDTNTMVAAAMRAAAADDNYHGYWLIKPDGTPAFAWQRYRQLITESDPTRATADAVKSHLTLLYQDTFNRPDSKTDIGPAWTQNAHYAPISGELKNHKLVFTMQAGTTPWSNATLDLTNRAILGRGLRPGEYAECTLQRLTSEGGLGLELYSSDQLRFGPDLDPGPSPIRAWTGRLWTPLSYTPNGAPQSFDWTHPHTLGVRFDSADGHFATFSFYLDNTYAGSWLVKVGAKTLDKFGLYAQSRHPGATLQFSDLKLYGRP